MGIISEPKKKERERPELPSEFLELFDHYKRLRFGRSIGEDVVTLIPREPLTFSEIAHYAAVMQANMQPWEIDVIMLIDAIFESRDLGG